MSLPLLNENPRYELVIPSTGKKVKFRPYLVKEEKILMLAAETKDPKQMMNAIVDTVTSCITSEKINVNDLTTFDLEYLFIKLRAKSVGESSKIQVTCENCKIANEYDINLDSIECKNSKINNMIKLDDSITVEMKYPSYSSIDVSNNESEMGFGILANCISAVHTNDQRIDVSEESEESIRKFLESMTRTQFEKLTDFISLMPQVVADVDFVCRSCETHNKFDVKGIQSFF